MNLKRQKVDSQRIEKTNVLIRESFSDFVRLERRNLLAIAAASLFAVLSGATVQADVTIFGLKFSGLQQIIFSFCYFLSACIFLLCSGLLLLQTFMI